MASAIRLFKRADGPHHWLTIADMAGPARMQLDSIESGKHHTCELQMIELLSYRLRCSPITERRVEWLHTALMYAVSLPHNDGPVFV